MRDAAKAAAGRGCSIPGMGRRGPAMSRADANRRHRCRECHRPDESTCRRGARIATAPRQRWPGRDPSAYTREPSTRGGHVAQADPAPRTRTRTAQPTQAGNGKAPAARRRDRRQRPAARAPSPASGSSRRASSAAPTTGRASRSSARSSTSACSRSSRATRSRASWTRWSGCCRRSRTTPARLGRRGGFITRLREGTWVGPRRRAHRARVPEPRRHRRPPRQDPRHRRVRPLQRDLRVPRGAGRDRGRQGRPSGSSTTSSRRATTPFAFDLMAELEKLILLAERLAFGPSARRRCSTRRPAATSRTSGSTGSASSSSARASTSSGSARR